MRSESQPLTGATIAITRGMAMRREPAWRGAIWLPWMRKKGVRKAVVEVAM